MYGYKKRTSKIRIFLVLSLSLVGVFLGGKFVYSNYVKVNIKDNGEGNKEIIERLSYKEEEEKEEEISIEEAAEAVVGISKIKNTGASVFNINANNELGLGSGFIVSNNGYIITNWHVVQNKYSNCYITLANGDIENGTVVWSDQDLDISIIKIKKAGLKHLKLGDSKNLKLGETVYAIGNPIGREFQRTVTSGIISGKNRTIKIEDEYGENYMENLIQTDATINSGNSGGPLINKKGEVIGINTVKITSAEGIGFAVPINTIKPIIESFINTGNFEEAYLGIFAYDKEAIFYLNSGIKLENGIYVAKISETGPSAKTELRVGDIITKIDGRSIDKMSELREYIYTKKVGDTVALNILRNKREKEIIVTLTKK